MKKKIAGVLTTVLAASFFVGGNVPVTTQVGSMAAESQEDEDTQADEAEAESKEIGTPYTIINGEKGEFIVNGAQDGVMFVKALKDATGIN